MESAMSRNGNRPKLTREAFLAGLDAKFKKLPLSRQREIVKTCDEVLSRFGLALLVSIMGQYAVKGQDFL